MMYIVYLLIMISSSSIDPLDWSCQLENHLDITRNVSNNSFNNKLIRYPDFSLKSGLIISKDSIGDPIIINNMFSDSVFRIGTTWTYTARNYPASFVGFQKYTIVDTLMWEGKLAYKIDPGLSRDFDYMVREGDKVYFWDEELLDYQLQYHFGNDSLYYIKYKSFGANPVDSAIVRIDSVIIQSINGVDHAVQYCRSDIVTGGTMENFFEIIDGVGPSYGGLRLHVRFVIDNFTNEKQQIRCFENDTTQYIFSDVVCDSTWFTVSVVEEDTNDLTIYPNPTSGQIYIDGLDHEVDYKLYDTSGKLIQIGITHRNSIFIEQSGFFLLEIIDNGLSSIKRIIKLE